MDSIKVDSGTMIPPTEKSYDTKYVKHVICEGAYFHVLSYDSNGTHCSEPNCIYNKPIEEN